MDLATYVTRVSEGIEFLVAFCSLIGFFGLVFGFIMMVSGKFNKNTAFRLILISAILVGFTGMYTGLKYFNL